ncbi:MAG: hypothetical protein ABSF09_12280 [Candidatus Bathyarchaeia archaeon]
MERSGAERKDLAVLEQEISEAIQELRELVRKLPIASTLSNIAMRIFLTSPEVELQDISPIYAEYVTWLYLCNFDSAPNPLAIDEVTSEDDLEKVFALSMKAVKLVEDYSHARVRGKGRLGDNPEDILVHTRILNLLMRGEAFRHHMTAQLHALFDPFSKELQELIGFDITDALGIFDGLDKVVNSRILKCESIIYRESKSERPDLHKTPGPGELRKQSEEVNRYLIKTMRPVAHRIFLVTCEELTKVTEIDQRVIRKFLDLFTPEFGQEEIGAGWPSVYDALDRAPFLKLSDELWLVHLVGQSIFRFRAAIENILEQNDGLWRRYESHRSDYLENHAVALIKSTTRHADAWVNLHYSYDDGQGVRDFELDGLVLVDRTAFLIEAKAGSMSTAARRGSRSAIDQLKRLVDDAQKQNARAARYIRSSEEVYFESPKGDVRLRSKNIIRMYLISVTLDSLTAFTTNMSWLSRAGIVSGNEAAWSVFDLDLQVIVELVNGVGEFVSYLERRIAVQDLEAFATEELDWFGLFLDNQLLTERIRASNNVIIFPDVTGPIQDYYHHVLGVRSTPTPKPRQKMPKTMQSLVEILEKNGATGFIDGIAILLEQTDGERAIFAKSVDKLWSYTKKHKDLAFRTRLETGSVLCYSRSHKLLKEYTKAAKYSMKSDNAVCILQTTRQGALVHVERYPWKQDVVLERLARELLGQARGRIKVVDQV